MWTLKAERSDGSYGYVVMYALPKTVKHKRTRGGYRATFDAKAVFNLSEVSPEGMDAALTCSLVYEL